MLILNNLKTQYDGISMSFSLSMKAGERLAILGPSGAGKSTLLSLIAGFLPVSSGQLFLEGRDHTYTMPAQRPLSVLFQENNLFPWLNVAQNIGLGLDPGLKLNPCQKSQIKAIANEVGLQTHLTRLPGNLSGGQRQRVALARCLVRERPILLLDEPFSALDATLRKNILTLVARICKERNLTLLMVSHDREEAAQIASRAVHIVDGRVHWQGSFSSQGMPEATASS